MFPDPTRARLRPAFPRCWPGRCRRVANLHSHYDTSGSRPTRRPASASSSLLSDLMRDRRLVSSLWWRVVAEALSRGYTRLRAGPSRQPPLAARRSVAAAPYTAPRGLRRSRGAVALAAGRSCCSSALYTSTQREPKGWSSQLPRFDSACYARLLPARCRRNARATG